MILFPGVEREKQDTKEAFSTETRNFNIKSYNNIDRIYVTFLCKLTFVAYLTLYLLYEGNSNRVYIYIHMSFFFAHHNGNSSP